MGYYVHVAIAALVTLGISSCTGGTDPCEEPWEFPPEDFSDLSITQGLSGHVFFMEGDHATGCVEVTPVIRSVLVFPRLEGSQREELDLGFIRVTGAEPFDSVRSDADGFYQISLPPSEYTLLVREDSRLYAMGSAVLTVTADSVTKRRIDIRYKFFN